MSDLLTIGASGVRAYQGALTTISENIANSGVAGYSRRTTDLAEVTSTSSDIAQRKITNGNGVIVTGTSRAVDLYRNAGVRTASSDLARTEASGTWLTAIEGALTENKLGGQLTGFFTAAQTLAADPSSIPARSVMIEAAKSAADAFAATGTGLDRAATELDATAKQSAATLSSLAQTLAKVNDGLTRTPAKSATAAQLGDQRDNLLEQMSAISDLGVTIDTLGRATVRLGGQSGPEFVSNGGEAGRLSYLRNPQGAVALTVDFNTTRSAVTPSGGALAGLMDGAQRIADARYSLNQIATDFTGKINQLQSQGRDLDGQPGAALFATGATPTDITVTLDDPRGIAAAGPNGSIRDASNLAAFQSVRGTASFESRTTALVAGNAAALEQRNLVAGAQSSIRDGAVAARDAVSGVNLDTEAVELLRFQQAYQASSRVIQVAKDTMQTLLDIR